MACDILTVFNSNQSSTCHCHRDTDNIYFSRSFWPLPAVTRPRRLQHGVSY